VRRFADVDERAAATPGAGSRRRTPAGGGGRGLAVTLTAVDVRIGVTQAPRELTVEVDDGERDDVKARVDAALAGVTDVLWITDKRGKQIGVPSAKIAYVEVGTPDGDRRIGFGG
jgi:hypothetical protein